MRLQFLLLASLFVYASSLQNGIAKTPPMGWMSWAKFYCEIDCNKYPNACINADLYQGQADRMVSDGYLAAGYTGVHIDDCWLEYDRSSDGKLVPNRTRFPSGMDGLAKYMHDRGLQLAIYEDVGTKTCAGYPGSWQHETIDAQTFAAWGIDYLKYDGCNLDYHQFNVGFPAMRDALASAGRPIVYSIEWDAQYIPKDQWGNINYSFIAQVSNLNRDYYDVSKSWDSIANIIDHFVANQDRFIAIQGPGYWNDPDMIVVGNSDITLDQARVQMSVWSSWSAPLIMSNDLRAMPPGHADILLNKYVIAVDQDPLGIMARMVNVTGNCNVYPWCQMTFVKPMTPVIKNGTYSYAVAIVNRDTTAHPVSFMLSNLGLTNPSGYNVMDLWAGKIVGTYKPSDTYTANVNGTGVHFIKATALQ